MTTREIGRRNGTQAKRMNDYATIDECVRIAVGVCEREYAKREAARAARAWHRRLWRFLRRGRAA